MKISILLSVVLTVLTFSNTIAQQQKGYIISGTITDKDTGKVYLRLDSDNDISDSAQLKKGKFVFKGTAPSPVVMWISLAENKQLTGFFGGNEKISFTASKTALNKAVVKGAALNNAFKQYQDAWSAIHERAGKYYKFGDSLRKANGGKLEGASKDLWEMETKKMAAFAYHIQDSCIKENSNTAVAAYIMDVRYLAWNEWEKIEEMYSFLGAGAKDSWYGKKITEAKEIEAKTAVGSSPAFTQPDTSGNLITLAAFKGRYVLVDFWASWCGPCRRENPNVVAAYQKFHDKGFDIIGISLDNNKKQWLDAIRKDGLNWTHLSDLKGWQNEVAIRYGVKIVPTSLLIDPQGKVIAKNLRGEALHKKLESLLH